VTGRISITIDYVGDAICIIKFDAISVAVCYVYCEYYHVAHACVLYLLVAVCAVVAVKYFSTCSAR